MENEIWKDIPGFEGYYQVSNLGKVRHLFKHYTKIKKTTIDSWGYEAISLCVNYVPSTRKIHRLVALAFIPNPENKPFVNHKDGNKLNNRLENLEWVTQSENVRHAYDVLKRRPAMSYGGAIYGEHPLSRKIKQFTIDGEFVKEWSSIKEATEYYGVSLSNISGCCLGRNKTAYGFIWEFADKGHEIIHPRIYSKIVNKYA